MEQQLNDFMKKQEQQTEVIVSGINGLLKKLSDFFEEKRKAVKKEAEAKERLTNADLDVLKENLQLEKKNTNLTTLATIANVAATTFMEDGEGYPKASKRLFDEDELLEYKAKMLKILKEL